jgi:Tfp pilus assembly protein PilX
MHRTRTRDEQGSALVFALVMLSVVGLMVAAALTYAGTSLRSSNNDIRPNRGSLYAADSAIQGAIQYVANSPQVGSDLLGAKCTPDAYQYTDAKAGTVSVDVCPQANSFVYDGGVRAVLLTLAPSGDGIVQTKNSTLTVNGNVWSNSSIDVRGLAVGNGQAWSWNSCSGNVTAASGKDCATGTTYGYSKLASAMTAAQTTVSVAANAQFPSSGGYVVVVDTERMLVTAGQGTNTWTVVRGYMGTTAATHAANARVSFLPKPGIDPGDPVLGQSADWQPATSPGIAQSAPFPCTLQPGVYSHGDDLSDASRACTTLTLSHGVYYLNFPADGSAPSKSDTDDTWTVSKPLQGPPCSSDADPGVQLVLAGPSRISNADTIDLPCGARATATGPRIAVTSLNSSIAGGTSMQTVLRPSASATQAGDNVFDPTTLANVVPTTAPGYPADSTNASASFSGNKKVALLNIGVSPPVGSIPANAVIDSAIVRVAHDETTNAPFQSATALKWGTCTVALTPTPSPTATVYSANVTSAVSSCSGFDPSQSAILAWSLKTTNGSAAKIDVDGAQLEVTWHTPGLPSQSGCVYHNVGGNCPAVGSASSNGHDSFLVDDVVYLPNSQLQTTCKNSCSFNIGQALIAWQAVLDANPAALGDPIIGGQINTSGPGDVIFRAHVGAQPWISTRVKYTATTRNSSIASWVISH